MANEFSAVWESNPVDLVMGSDSDRGAVAEAVTTLREFEIGFNARVISAHRTPELLEEYTREIRLQRAGLVIVAFAGKSAALGGDIAARVPGAVIGVPLEPTVDTQNSAVGAQINMPPGSGLTIVGPNQGTNAALAAVRTLAVSDPAIRERMLAYKDKKRLETEAKDAELVELGWDAWLLKHPIKS